MSLTVDELKGIIATVEMIAYGGIDLSIDTDFEDVFRLDDIKNFNPKSHWGWNFELPKSLEELEDAIFKAKASLVALEFAKIVLANWKDVTEEQKNPSDFYANKRIYRAEIVDEIYEVSFTVDEHGCYRQPLWVSKHHR